MRFTDQLWQQITPVYEAILAHGFVRELGAGTLSAASFQYYIQQDALYLTDFSRALAQLAAKSSDSAHILLFSQFAENAIRVEQALHQTYFALFGIEPVTTKKPACFAYTNYLLATTALESVAVGSAAVLPCFWIYQRVGTHIYQQAISQNPYQTWIDTYAGEAFEQSVNQMIALTDQFAEEAGPLQRQKMTDAFQQASRLEWAFWNDAYTLNKELI